MPSRLIISFALSLALHCGLLLPASFMRHFAAPPRAPLHASLRLPPPAPVPIEEDALIKNTLDATEAPPPSAQAPLPAPPSPAARSAVAAEKVVRKAQKQLSRHLYYPPKAIAQGLEGDVHLILRLNSDGTIETVNLAASSGHPLLDNAAIRAAHAMGRISAGSRELILPVHFRLQ